MLRSMQVRNFAIIDEITIDLETGMTVLTGETGAGKSILVDALGLVLGERGGSGLVRDGAKRAEFSAEFDIADLETARDWLVDQALDSDDECHLRRVVGLDGRSRAFINGNAVSLQSLKALGELLLDIHGQHFHQSLGKPEVQRDLLDHFGDLGALRQEVEQSFREWRALEEELAELSALETDREARLELLEFQVSELDSLELEDTELESLNAERQKLQNVNRLAEGLAQILDGIYEGESATVQSRLAAACQQLQELCTYDGALEPARQLLEEASIQVTEAADELRRYADALDADPARRDWVEDRLAALKSVARKHRVEVSDLGEVQTRLRDQLDGLRHAEQRTEALEAKAEVARNAYLTVATQLSARRQESAAHLSAAVSTAMAGLGMPGGRFAATVTEGGIENARSWGVDAVEYRISANPGQPEMPLSKVASGGELSRMSLAIQVIASGGSRIPTMVFDEVDSGVGGGIAEMVGRRLSELGADRQVLCVTHLPQVACQADQHIRINKITDGKSTRTGIRYMTGDERVEELARMLGGVEITRRTRDHAAEMLAAGGRGA